MHSKPLLVTGAIIFGTIAITIGAASLARALGPRTPRAEDGTLDLRDWDFASSGSVNLGGRWKFLPEEFSSLADLDSRPAGSISTRNVPDIRPWLTKNALRGTGSGTYWLRILLPPGSRGLAVRYSSVRTAFELEVNGSVAARIGNPSLDPALAVAAFNPGIVRVDAVDGRLDIVARVSNHEYRWGGIARPFALGDRDRMLAAKRAQDIGLLVLVGFVVGIAANSSFIFAFRRREKAYLYFAVFAVTVALRALVAEDAILTTALPSLGFGLLVRLQYASLILLLPSGALFFAHLFPEDIGRREMTGLVVPSLALILFLAFAPLIAATWGFLLFAPILLASTTWGFAILCVRPILRRRPASGIVLGAGILLLASAAASGYYVIGFAKGEISFSIGPPIFVIVQTLALAKRFTSAFDKVEALSSELELANSSLKVEIGVATDARLRLETALVEKEKLLQEVHHRVKNSLQIVSSIINLQTYRTRDPAALQAYLSVNDRIRAISGVHDTLYGLDSEERVSLGPYARELVQQFTASRGEGEADIELRADDIDVPMDLCIELGLAFTELISNAYRYAVVPAGRGKIRVELRVERGQLLLLVGDDGPGFPPGFSADAADSVGFKIITLLARQRGGTVSLSSGPCAVVTLRIPLAGDDTA